ncbi:hypothetical protein LPJ61_004917 [Coemansia biformis]|uniref:G-patch domain-containing protein n=1 Tax=Coemansia biformis TaxID=1286918 RepID=A0A9W7YAW8_9FUNG|nr:hypothetical protein LPJ61_004917 [Coemansia biformis]
MAKRQYDSERGQRTDDFPDANDRVDYIYVGTEFQSPQEQRRRELKGRRGQWDDKPKDYSRDAFKGGFSAGYFGTVGSKEGWRPSAEFVSSRGSRAQLRQLRPEDYMDAEDLADLQASQSITVNSAFDGAGQLESGVTRALDDGGGAGYAGVVGAVAEMLASELGAVQICNNRVGDRIMAVMGWKPGQGVGPLTRDAGHPAGGMGGTVSLLPPRPVPTASAALKQDWHGIGYGVDLNTLPADAEDSSDGPLLPLLGTLFKRKPASASGSAKRTPGADSGKSVKAGRTKQQQQQKKVDRQRLSFGVFDDDDDDDADYNSGGGYIAGRSTAPSKSVGSELGDSDPPPSQLARLASEAPARPAARQALMPGITHCHDDRPPLPGFTLFAPIEPATGPYEGPSVPSTFTGIRRPAASRWDAVPATGSESRLGDRGGGGSRSRPTLVTANDRAQLGIMEAARKPPPPPPPRGQQVSQAIVDTETARAALEGFMPYSSDPARQARYRRYLEQCAAGSGLDGVVSADEEAEFSHMARIFKPNTAMLSRFATAGSSLDADSGSRSGGSGEGERRGRRKEVARTVHEWAPHQLLCKRMGLPAPANAAPLKEAAAPESGRPRRMRAADFIQLDSGNMPLVMANDAHTSPTDRAGTTKRPDMALFQSIFGDGDGSDRHEDKV